MSFIVGLLLTLQYPVDFSSCPIDVITISKQCQTFKRLANNAKILQLAICGNGCVTVIRHTYKQACVCRNQAITIAQKISYAHL
jgi:hypothetical protein